MYTDTCVLILAGGDSYVKIHSISMSPYPPKFEAELTFSVEAEILKTVNNFHINLEIKKNILGIAIPIPCIDGIGSWLVLCNVCG